MSGEEKRTLADSHCLFVGTELLECIEMFIFFLIQTLVCLVIHMMFYQHSQQSSHPTTVQMDIFLGPTD